MKSPEPDESGDELTGGLANLRAIESILGGPESVLGRIGADLNQGARSVLGDHAFSARWPPSALEQLGGSVMRNLMSPMTRVAHIAGPYLSGTPGVATQGVALVASALDRDRAYRAQLPAASIMRVADVLPSVFNSPVASTLGSARLSALGALGAAAREAGLAEEIESATDVELPDGDAIAALAEADSAGAWEEIAPADVILGFKAARWLVAACVAVWLATGDDAVRFVVGTFAAWLGLAGTGAQADAWIERRLTGESGHQSGG